MSDKKNKINCSVCGEILKLEYKFCPSCGAAVDYLSEKKSESIEDNGESNKVEIKKSDSFQKLYNTEQKKKSVKQVKESHQETHKPLVEKKISAIRLFYILFSLAIIGIIIIFASGTFDKPTVTRITTDQNNINDFHSGVDLSSLEQINSLEKELKTDPKNKSKLLTLAHLLNDSGFKEKAIERYKEYLKYDPQNADVLVDMGVCYYELGKNNEAIKLMKEALKYQPNHQIAHLNLGIISLSEGKREEAILWWKKAAEINPNNEVGKRAQELIQSH